MAVVFTPTLMRLSGKANNSMDEALPRLSIPAVQATLFLDTWMPVIVVDL